MPAGPKMDLAIATVVLGAKPTSVLARTEFADDGSLVDRFFIDGEMVPPYSTNHAAAVSMISQAVADNVWSAETFLDPAEPLKHTATVNECFGRWRDLRTRDLPRRAAGEAGGRVSVIQLAGFDAAGKSKPDEIIAYLAKEKISACVCTQFGPAPHFHYDWKRYGHEAGPDAVSIVVTVRNGPSPVKA